MTNPKETFTRYWVTSLNNLLQKLQLETIQPEEFINLVVQNQLDTVSIIVLCTDKTLVLNLDDNNKKLSGGWHNF